MDDVLRDPMAETMPTQLRRDHIAETLNKATVYAQHAADYVHMRDDRALARAVKMLCILSTGAASALPDLFEGVEADRRLIEAARAAHPRKPDPIAMARAEREARGSASE